MSNNLPPGFTLAEEEDDEADFSDLSPLAQAQAMNLATVLQAVQMVRQKQAASNKPMLDLTDDSEVKHAEGSRSATKGPCRCGYKHWIKGKEYDWSISVPTNVGMLCLGYNKGEDHYEAIDRFFFQHTFGDKSSDPSTIAHLVGLIVETTEGASESPSNTHSTSNQLVNPFAFTPAKSEITVVADPKEEEKKRKELEDKNRKLKEEKDKEEAKKQELKKRIELDRAERKQEAERKKKEAEEYQKMIEANKANPTPINTSGEIPNSIANTPHPPANNFSTPKHGAFAIEGDDDEEYEDDDDEEFRKEIRSFPVKSLKEVHKKVKPKAEWTGEDVIETYQSGSKEQFLNKLSQAGFTPPEMIQILNYAISQTNLNPELRVKEAKKQKKPSAFQGQGHSLRPETPTNEQIQPTQVKRTNTIEARPAVPTTNPVQVDKEKPKTSIKIRTHDGQSLVAQFNHTHTILDIRRHIEFIVAIPIGANYDLSIPPRTVLADNTKTIAEVGLLQGLVIQSPLRY